MESENERYISLAQAAEDTPYSQEYLSLLARKGKLHSRKIGRNWYTTREAVAEYIQRQKDLLIKELEIKTQTQTITAEEISIPSEVKRPPAKLPHSLSLGLSRELVWNGLAVIIVTLIFFSFGVMAMNFAKNPSTAWDKSQSDLRRFAIEARESLEIPSALRDEVRVLAGIFSGVTDKIADLIYEWILGIRRTRVAEESQIDADSNADTRGTIDEFSTSSNNNRIVSEPVEGLPTEKEIIRVREVVEHQETFVPADLAVVRNEILTDVEEANRSFRAQFENALNNLTLKLSRTTSSTDSNTRIITLSQKIDTLGDATLSNITFSGTGNQFNLIDADIPDTITAANYLPLGGGTMTGILNLEKNLAFTNQATTTIPALTVNAFNISTSSSAVPFFTFDTQNYRVGIGTSSPGNTFSIAGSLLVSGNTNIGGALTVSGTNSTSTLTAPFQITRVPTLAHAFTTWQTGAAGANGTDASLVIRPSSAASDTNLFSVMVGTSTYFLVDAEGDVFAKSITTEGGNTLSSTTASNFLVENSTYLGDAISDSVFVNSGTIQYNNRATSTIQDLTINSYSIATSTTVVPFFTLDTRNYRVGIGTTSPGGTLAVSGNLVVGGEATSTFANGIQLSNGCFRGQDGNCVGGLSGGQANRVAFWTSSSALSNDDTLIWDNTNKRFGLGTTTPASLLSIHGNALISGTSTTGSLIATSTVFVGSTGQFFNVLSSGLVGIGTTSPAQLLSVQGQCVTGDTRLKRRRRKKGKNGEWIDGWEEVPIKDILSGDEILTLDEKSGMFVWSKIKELKDMGVKQTYALITSTGKVIRTTANHPYFVRPLAHDAGTIQKSTYNYAEHLAREFYFTELHGQRVRVPALDSEVSFTRSGWEHFIEKKRSLNELITRFFALPRVETTLVNASRIVAYQKREKPDMRIEYWTVEEVVEHVLVRVVICAVNGGSKFFLSCSWLGTKELQGFVQTKKELSLSEGKSPRRRRGMDTPQLFMHSLYSPRLDVSRGVWKKVAELSLNYEVATIDGWEKIIAITPVASEQVYDIEVEGTHNFIGNDIVAHNTLISGTSTAGSLIATSTLFVGGTTGSRLYVAESGNVGIGTTTPGSLLSVQGGNAQITGTTTTHALVATSTLFVGPTGNLFNVLASGNVGIGTTSPASLLSVQGQCVTGDTRLRRRRRRRRNSELGTWNLDSDDQAPSSKLQALADSDYIYVYDEVAIRDIQPEDEIASLNEKTGQIVWSKVNALLDMGVKPIYKLTTALGKTIRTTAEHPYLVQNVGGRRAKHMSPIAGAGWLEASAIAEGDVIATADTGAAKSPRAIAFIDYANIKSWLADKGLYIDLPLLHKVLALAGISDIRFYYGTAKDRQNTGFLRYLASVGFHIVTKPVQYFVIRLVDLFKRAQNRRWIEALSDAARGLILKEAERLDQAGIDLFEPKANFDVEITGDALQAENVDIIILFSGDGDFTDLVRRLKSSGKKAVVVAGRKFLSGSLMHEADKFVTLERLVREVDGLVWDENKAKPAAVRQVLKNCTSIIARLLGLSSPMTVDNQMRGGMQWERVEKVEHTPFEQVYDIEVEGTHNFIGNDIVAHNTLISGTSTAGSLIATSTLFVGGTTGSSMVVLQNGNVGIGTTTPGSLLSVQGVGNFVSAATSTLYTTLSLPNLYSTSTTATSSIAGSLYVASSTPTQNALFAVGTSSPLLWVDRNTGNLGIGTSSPASSLSISSSISNPGLLLTYTGGGNTLYIEDAANDTTPFVIDSSGNVGIGTTSPEVDRAAGSAPLTGGGILALYSSDPGINFGRANGSWSIFLDSTPEIFFKDAAAPDNQATIRNDLSALNDDGWATGAVDYAEFMEKLDPTEDIQIYDVVGIKNGKITKNTKGSVLNMITSTDAGIRGGNPLVEGYSRDEDPNWLAVAYIGQMPVLVEGEVNEGDYIIPSGNNDGRAKAVSSNTITRDQFNQAIGRALESDDNPIYNTMDVSQDPNDPEQDSEIFFELEKMQQRKGNANIINVAVGVHMGWPKLDINTSFAQGLTSAGGETLTNGWSVDQQSGKVNVSFFGDINLQGNSILDVGKITGYLGKWSIDEDGTLMAVKVVTDEVIAKNVKTEKLCIGSTCVTEEQLKELLEKNQVSDSSAPPSPPPEPPPPAPEPSDNGTATSTQQ